MKCVCGYEYEETWNENGHEILIGDEAFIGLDCHITMRQNLQDKKVNLYACPKCKTVQVDINTYY